MQTWLDLANKLQDLGCHTLAIKDMAGLLDPYVGYELVSKLKESIEIPIHLHSHATTCSCVAMKMNRNLNAFFKLRNKLISYIWI